MTLSPFQKRCIERTDDRIILQPRRTGSTVMQRRLAKNRLESAGVKQVAVVLPDASMRDIWLRDHGAAEEPNLITMSAEAGVERARRPGVVIVDQCQHISDIEFWKMQDCWPDDAEWVLSATGSSRGKGTALDAAAESGGFSLIWADLIEGIYDFHNDPEDVAGYFEKLPA